MSNMNKKERYDAITQWFEVNMPDPRSELNYTNAFELLVAVVLSAQCTDKRVNMVTPSLFMAYPDAESLANAKRDELYEYIKSISYPNAKTDNLIKMARRLCDVYGGDVPGTVKELETLSGVGRKTANVIVSIIFDTPAMAVDTHVYRVSKRIGLVTQTTKTPLEAERQLTNGFDRSVLAKAHHWLILHGRYVCTARKPNCSECGISDWCAMNMRNLKREARELAEKTQTSEGLMRH